MNDKRRKEIIEKLITKGKNEIDITTVYCNKKDKKHIQNFNCKEIDIMGGVILENEDKSIRIDSSFETLLKNIKDNSLQEIARKLF